MIKYRGEEAAQELTELDAGGRQVTSTQADVADSTAISDQVDRTVETLGSLVSNSGVEHFGSVESITRTQLPAGVHR
jgi:NAD(P)-dependent dehydrogenase (short-subunit alcohol dehydrogenase family)